MILKPIDIPEAFYKTAIELLKVKSDDPAWSNRVDAILADAPVIEGVYIAPEVTCVEQDGKNIFTVTLATYKEHKPYPKWEELHPLTKGMALINLGVFVHQDAFILKASDRHYPAAVIDHRGENADIVYKYGDEWLIQTDVPLEQLRLNSDSNQPEYYPEATVDDMLKTAHVPNVKK